MNYKVVNVIALGQDLKETIISLLAEEGYESFWELDSGLKAFIKKEIFDQDLLQSILSPFNHVSFEVQDLEEVNWNEKWESEFTHFEVSNHCLVMVPDYTPIKKYDYQLIIEPDMTFGTGHHPTTNMILNHILDIEILNKDILDAGSGTGVLAILAKKRGAKFVYAYDIDTRSVQNIHTNMGHNNVVFETEVGTITSISPSVKKYDIVFANINKNILLHDIPYYSTYVKENGYLVISGFLKDDAEDLIAHATGFEVSKRINEEEWACLVLTKQD